MSEQTQEVSRETNEAQDPTPAYKKDHSTLKFERVPVNPYAPSAHASAQTIDRAPSATQAMTAGAEPLEEQTTDTEQTEPASEDQKTSEENQSPVDSNTQTKKEPRSAQILNQIAKEKAELRREKQRLEELKKQAESNPQLSIEELRKLAQEDPIEFARKVGVDEREFYNSYTDRILKGDETPEQAHIKKLEAQLSEFQKKFETREEQEARQKVEQTTQNFKNVISNYVKENAEKYELINTLGATETVYEVIKQYHDQTKKLLSLDEASEIVENQLEEDLSSQLKKLATAKKIQKLGLFKEILESKEQNQEVSQASVLTEGTSKTSEPTSEDPAAEFAKQRKMNRTITNQMVGQSKPNNRPMTREERMKEAAKLLRNAGA